MKNQYHVALINPEIPQNVGTIVRTCSCLNVTLHIVHPIGFIWDQKLLKRAGMDYLDKCHIVQHISFSEFIDYCKKNDHRMLGSVCGKQSPDGISSFADIKYNEKDMILFGKESVGLGDAHIQKCDKLITIPMHESSRSFNVSVSVGMILSRAVFSNITH